MGNPFESTFIIFADMLGFADLVEKEGDNLDELSPIFTEVELYSPTQAESLLGYRFINFHSCLNKARVSLQKLGAGTAIVFSDSAFFRTETFENAVNLARELMLDFVTSEIPVRMGIAQGSYRLLRFLADSSQHVSFHMSQFLGTGIVRAFKAEQCGIPGLRILLHPNLDSFAEQSVLKIIPVVFEKKQNLNVKYEVNYLSDPLNNMGPDFEDCIQFDCLRWMSTQAEDKFQHHYIETFNAWNKMRMQLGRLSYPWEKYLNRDEYDYTHGIRQRPIDKNISS